ncbi:hypothetical protein CPLU01_01759 [Colletotrichum plurivorum]|uniref:Uncharacterized protein n=1 Tax=Colletotrichum plurivorum TaxID=2175906 RepID=A0A8H6KXQ9_9PEZI|nr:hypothetical protein CPLU01_01759 [Colletotrichum plurivorum]
MTQTLGSKAHLASRHELQGDHLLSTQSPNVPGSAAVCCGYRCLPLPALSLSPASDDQCPAISRAPSDVLEVFQPGRSNRAVPRPGTLRSANPLLRRTSCTTIAHRGITTRLSHIPSPHPIALPLADFDVLVVSYDEDISLKLGPAKGATRGEPNNPMQRGYLKRGVNESIRTSQPQVQQ